MSSKCDNCCKNILKSRPGLQCNRCEKIVHLTNQCSGLTNKQLSAIRLTENLEWTCQECQDSSPKRRSIIIPDEEEEVESSEESHNVRVDIKQILEDISKEMEKTIKKQMREVTQSLQFNSDKMDELIKTIENLQGNISTLQKKNVELTNRNNHLEVRVGALEQRLQDIEQRKLSKYVEVHNLPLRENENLNEVMGTVAKKLNQNTEHIKLAKRLPGRGERPGPVQVELKSEEYQMSWITAAKSKRLEIASSVIVPGALPSKANDTVFICEALTPYNKQLLWNAKQELKNTFKYIWVKKGIIRVRNEGENQKPCIIRSLEDINKLKATQKTTIAS